MTEWESEQMRPWLHHSFSTQRHWHSFLGWRHFHLPYPHPPSLSSAVILFKDCYLYPSSQVSQVKTESQPTREAQQLQRLYCSPFSCVCEERAWVTQPPFSLPRLIVTPSSSSNLFRLPQNARLSPHQTQWQEGWLPSEINKPCSNTHTHQHWSAGLL